MEIPVNFGQVNFKFTGVGAPLGAEVTHGFAISGAGAPEDVAGVWAAAWQGTVRTQQSNEVTLSSILVKFGPNDVGPSDEIPIGLAGSAAAGSCAPNTAVLARKVTALGGHAGRGRWYWPGILETQVGSNGFLTPTTLSNYQDEFDGMHSFLSASDFPPVLLHAEGSPITTPTVVTRWLVDPRVATQRRRLRK